MHARRSDNEMDVTEEKIPCALVAQILIQPGVHILLRCTEVLIAEDDWEMMNASHLRV